MLPLTPQAFESGRPESNGPPRSGAPVLFRLSYVRARSLRQESNPHLGRTKGACLPLTLRRLDGDGGSRTRSSSLQARCSATRASSPRCSTCVVRTDGVEPPQREAPRLQRGELTLAQRPLEPRTEGGRPGSNRRRRGSQPRVLPLHHGHHEAGTTGLEPAASRLTSECSARLSYVPVECAGGIRTHGLELMRLARTTAPLPRNLAGRSRTCGLRRPKPAGWPSPLQPEANNEHPRRDSNPQLPS